MTFQTAPDDLRILSLEQTQDPAGLQVQIHIIEDRTGGQTGHGAHLAQQRVKETGPNRGADIADRDAEALWHALQLRVVAQAQVGLGHAQRQVVKAQPGVEVDLLFGLGQVIHAICAVDFAGR